MGIAQFLTLLLGQGLVFAPALVQLFVFLWRQLLDALIALDCLGTLLRGQGRPFVHALLDALLPISRQAVIPVGKADPVLAAIGIELVPILLQWRQNGLLLGRKLGPGLTCVLRENRSVAGQAKRKSYCCEVV